MKLNNLVFISHSSIDKDMAHQIATHVNSLSLQAWMASRAIKPGANFAEEISRAIQRARAVIVVVSKDALLSEHVKREVNLAIEMNIQIIPVLIDASINDETKLNSGWAYWLNTLVIVNGIENRNLVNDLRIALNLNLSNSEKFNRKSKSSVLLTSLIVLLSMLVGYTLSSVFGDSASELQRVTYVHETSDTQSEVRDLPTTVKGYARFNSFSTFEESLEFRSGDWYIPQHWMSKDLMYPKCRNKFWALRWKNENSDLVIQSAFSSIWNYKEINAVYGFAGYEDAFSLYSESKIGSYGLMTGEGCESPAFKILRGYKPATLYFELRIWQKNT
jgi:hypothetical protein